VAEQSPRIRRFPRYHTGSQASALANFWQTEARLEVRLDPETKSLVFKYCYPVPAKIPPDCDHMYDAFFSVYRIDLEKHLEGSLQCLKSGRPALKYIDKFHHRAIQDGVFRWFSEMYNNSIVPPETKEEQIRKLDALPSKRSAPDAQRALIVWSRVKQVLTSVRLLRKTVDSKLLSRWDENALVKEIEKNGLRLEDVQAALQNLSGDPKWKGVRAFFDNSFGPTPLAHSIVQSELALDKRASLKFSVRKYVRRANQLLEALRDGERSKVTLDKKA
jgi:hypothetical protein